MLKNSDTFKVVSLRSDHTSCHSIADIAGYVITSCGISIQVRITGLSGEREFVHTVIV